jgi:hypothetical protein
MTHASYIISGVIYEDGTPVTFDIAARASTIGHDELLRLGVEHAREQHFLRPEDVDVPNLDDPYDQHDVRHWAICFARDRLTNYEQLEAANNERNEREQTDPCDRCRGLEKLEWETNMEHPHGLDAGCQECEANLYAANRRAEERRRLWGLAVMAWVQTQWPDLHVSTMDLEPWCEATAGELASAVRNLTRVPEMEAAS